jgi:hypothetical protein
MRMPLLQPNSDSNQHASHGNDESAGSDEEEAYAQPDGGVGYFRTNTYEYSPSEQEDSRTYQFRTSDMNNNSHLRISTTTMHAINQASRPSIASLNSSNNSAVQSDLMRAYKPAIDPKR